MADTMNPPVENAPAPAALVTPSDIVTPLGNRMPEATEQAAPATPPPSNPVSPTVAGNAPVNDPNEGKRDASGIKWSGKRFQVNPDGSPRLNSKGNFMFTAEYKGRAKKPTAPAPFGSTPAPAHVEPPPPSFDTPGGTRGDPNINPDAISQDEYDLAADVYLQSFYGPLIIAFSEHARPDREEHGALKGSLANLLRVKQVKEPSPGWAFALVAVAITVKKSAHPEIQKRAATWGERIKIWFGGKKFKAPQIQTSDSK